MKSLRGFAILSAIFILVVLAALSAFIISISSNQQIGSALDVQGVRAYQAARAGIEWGIFQVHSTPAYNFSYGTPVVAVNSADPSTRACPASPTTFAPAAATLAGFTVTVTCAATPDPGGFGGPTVLIITSTACNEPSAGACPNTVSPGNLYIERSLTVSF